MPGGIGTSIEDMLTRWARSNFAAGSAEVLFGAAFGASSPELRKDALALNDRFVLVCYLELMGVLNPPTFRRQAILPSLMT